MQSDKKGGFYGQGMGTCSSKLSMTLVQNPSKRAQNGVFGESGGIGPLRGGDIWTLTGYNTFSKK